MPNQFGHDGPPAKDVSTFEDLQLIGGNFLEPRTRSVRCSAASGWVVRGKRFGKVYPPGN